MKKILFLLLAVSTLCISCTEEDWNELFGIEEEEYDDSYGGNNDNGSYEYTYECPGGYSEPFTITIPAGSTSCQLAWEYYARAYACNNIDNFGEANCKLCNDCGMQDYCALCE